MIELGTPATLMDAQTDHEDGSVQARYSHITPDMTQRFLDGLARPSTVGARAIGSRPRFTRQKSTLVYHFDRRRDMYRDGVADFACRADDVSAGVVVRLLEAMYDL
jgi:hypothetical protein